MPMVLKATQLVLHYANACERHCIWQLLRPPQLTTPVVMVRLTDHVKVLLASTHLVLHECSPVSGLIEVAQLSAMGEYAEGKTVDVFSEMLDEVAIG